MTDQLIPFDIASLLDSDKAIREYLRQVIGYELVRAVNLLASLPSFQRATLCEVR